MKGTGFGDMDCYEVAYKSIEMRLAVLNHQAPRQWDS